MANRPIPWRFSLLRTGERDVLRLDGGLCKTLSILIAVLLLGTALSAQGTPQVAGVEPSSGKANDNVSLMGENLGKASVSAVFLSDDTTHNEAKIVEQSAEKIVFKVPRIKPGNYRISIRVNRSTVTFPFSFEVKPPG